MATIGIFGRLKDTVVPVRGPVFHAKWEKLDLGSGALTKVYEVTVPAGLIYCFTRIHFEGQDAGYLELRVGSDVPFRGRSSVFEVDKQWPFAEGEITADAGQAVEIWVQQFSGSTLEFTGDISGFTRPL